MIYLRSHLPVVKFHSVATVLGFIASSNLRKSMLVVRFQTALPWASYPVNPRPAALLMQSERVQIKWNPSFTLIPTTSTISRR